MTADRLYVRMVRATPAEARNPCRSNGGSARPGDDGVFRATVDIMSRWRAVPAAASTRCRTTDNDSTPLLEQVLARSERFGAAVGLARRPARNVQVAQLIHERRAHQPADVGNESGIGRCSLAGRWRSSLSTAAPSR